MFLDTETGMGIWTRHETEDGKVFYYNMKRDQSKWESDFQNESNTVKQSEPANENKVVAWMECNGRRQMLQCNPFYKSFVVTYRRQRMEN